MSQTQKFDELDECESLRTNEQTATLMGFNKEVVVSWHPAWIEVDDTLFVCS